jgi:hypothetical protein
MAAQAKELTGLTIATRRARLPDMRLFSGMSDVRSYPKLNVAV